MTRSLLMVSLLLLGLTLFLGCVPAAAPTAAPAATPTMAPATPPPPAPKYGGIMRFANETDPPNIDPHVVTGTASGNVVLQLYNSLLKYGPGAKIVPDLAERWETPDAKVYTFYLRKGVKFHNGHEMVAEDVKASYERIGKPETGSWMRGSISVHIDKIEVLDTHTVRFTLKAPMATFTTYAARREANILPKPLIEAGHVFKDKPVGTGAFKFRDQEPGLHIRLEKFADHFEKGIPYLDGINYLVLKDDTTRVNALLTGEADMIGYVPWKEMSRIEQEPRLRLYTIRGPWMTLMHNVSRKPFDNVKVRQAIGYAVNRQSIVDIVFFGRGVLITGAMMPEGTEWYNAELKDTYTYNPEKARQLLKEAGYDPSTPLKLMSSATHAMHYQSAEIVQADLKKVGMNVVLDLAEWPVAVERGNKGTYDFRVHGLGGNLIDPDFYTYYFGSDSTFYSMPVGFKDDMVDDLLNRGRTTLDPATRKKIGLELEKRLLELSPFTFLTWRMQGEAVKRELKGYQQLPGWLVFDSGVFHRYMWFDR